MLLRFSFWSLRYASIPISYFIHTDVVVLSPSLVESICRFGSCCDLHQNRFPGRNLCYTDDIAFLFAVVGVVVVEVVGTAGYYYPSIQNNRVVLVCLHLMVSFYPFSR